MITVAPTLYYLLSIYEFTVTLLKVLLISAPIFVGLYLLFEDLIGKMSAFDKEHETHYAKGHIASLVAISVVVAELLIMLFGG